MDEEEQRIVYAFKTVFEGVYGERVLKHLAGFCLEEEDLFSPDSVRINDYNQGRRSVILEIRKILNRELGNVQL